MAWKFIKRLFRSSAERRQEEIDEVVKELKGRAQLISRYPDPPRAEPTRVPTHECYVCGHMRAFVFCGACGAQQQKFQRGRLVIVPDAWAGEMLKNM